MSDSPKPTAIEPTHPTAKDASAPRSLATRLGGLPLGAALVLIVAMLCGTTIYVVHTVRSAGERAASGTQSAVTAAVNAARDLMRDVVNREVQVTFSDQATRINGSVYLQFATLENTTWFEFKDSASVAGVALPDVEFVARAPVEYSYYVDLNGQWDFVMPDEKTLEVYVPEIAYNAPAVDVSRLKWWVVKGSVLRDEEAAAERVKVRFSSFARQSARQNIRVVREEGRARVEEFVRDWVMTTYGEPSDLTIHVYFADEKTSPVPPLTGEE